MAERRGSPPLWTRQPDRTPQQPFDRLPVALRSQISPQLWRLACQPAGLYVELRGAPKMLYARWHLSTPPPNKHHLKPVAQSGLDCYGSDYQPGEVPTWQWAGSRTPWNAPDCNGALASGPLDGQQRTYRIYLPLANRIDRLEIGAKEQLTAVTTSDQQGTAQLPIVYYGTSIVHGEGVGRPGMPHASQLGRMLNREVINLGFCGKAFCEPVLAEWMGTVDTALYIVDCLPNNQPDELRQRLPEFLRILRAAKPATPILLVEDREFAGTCFQPQLSADRRAKNQALHEVIEQLRSEGCGQLHLARHPDWFGSDGEGTEDGSHPNDLGAWRMATALRPVIQSLLE